MSQFWHANWAEEPFKPKRLQNYEVPRWHAQWPDIHCSVTEFQADINGRVFYKSKKNTWSDFKGTWELPLKIDRSTANKLSKSTEYKKKFWEKHIKKNEAICFKNKNYKNNENQSKQIDDKVREDKSEDIIKITVCNQN